MTLYHQKALLSPEFTHLSPFGYLQIPDDVTIKELSGLVLLLIAMQNTYKYNFVEAEGVLESFGCARLFKPTGEGNERQVRTSLTNVRDWP